MTKDAADRREYETHWQMNPATRRIFDEAVDAAMAARGGAPIDVALDIGCGRQSNIVFPGARYLIGTDVDLEGLDENRTVDEVVAADIGTADLPPESVDAISCVYVLEHVEHPDRAFAKMARALRPGGVMVIAVPNVAAPKARITRMTPLWFHRFVYERLLDRRDPNTGHPFETVLDDSIRPDRLENLAAVCGLRVVRRHDFEDNKQRQLRTKFHLTGAPWTVVRGLVRLVTFGRVDAELSDTVMTFQRLEVEPSGELAERIAAARANASA